MPVEAEKDADATIAVARILRRWLSHPPDRGRVFRRLATFVAKRGARHEEQRAGPSNRETTLAAIRNLTPTSRHAHQFFYSDFHHYLDLQVAFGNQLLQAPILGLELLQPPRTSSAWKPPNRLSHFSLIPCRFATADTGSRSPSRMIASLFVNNAFCASLPPNREPVSHVIDGPKSNGQVSNEVIHFLGPSEPAS